MSVIQIIAISLFVYLGSIGSIVGNTIGWYTLGRPLVASFVVDVYKRQGLLCVEHLAARQDRGYVAHEPCTPLLPRCPLQPVNDIPVLYLIGGILPHISG